MSKSGAFPYIQVPIAEVADDLAHLGIEAEGAYFRVVRKLAVKGPLTAREIRASVNCDTTGMEHLLNHSSTDVEPRLSFSWLEEWRIRANASRDRLSAMGKTSAEKRAAKKGKKNIRSTTVQPTLSSSSTTVEPTTILSSTILSQGSEKEHTIAYPSDFPSAMRTPEALEAWGVWEQARKEKGKPITETARRLQLVDCQTWGTDRAIAALMHSAKGNYQGLFEPKADRGTLRPTAPQPETKFKAGY